MDTKTRQDQTVTSPLSLSSHIKMHSMPRWTVEAGLEQLRVTTDYMFFFFFSLIVSPEATGSRPVKTFLNGLIFWLVNTKRFHQSDLTWQKCWHFNLPPSVLSHKACIDSCIYWWSIDAEICFNALGNSYMEQKYRGLWTDWRKINMYWFNAFFCTTAMCVLLLHYDP